MCNVLLTLVFTLSGCRGLSDQAHLPWKAGERSESIAIREPPNGVSREAGANYPHSLTKKVSHVPTIDRHIDALKEFSGLRLDRGNRAELLVDGPQTFDAMFLAIRAAKDRILIESYILEDSEIAQQLAALLGKRRQEGVQIAVMYDAVGSVGTDDAFFENLRRQNISVCAFNPISPFERPGYWNITQRDHRKILVVDGKEGFTGGINISSVYSSGSGAGGHRRDQARHEWRDTQIRLQGPAVAKLEALVRTSWREQHCDDPLPATTPNGETTTPAGFQTVGILAGQPDDTPNQIYHALLKVIDSSQRSVFLTMAYFAPGEEMIEHLCAAAQRGVDVRLILPSRSDFQPVLEAGRAYYARLLDAGVRIYELQDAVLHAKTAVIDGVVSTVGSSNLDWRSFSSNYEVNAFVIDYNFGRAMRRMFDTDLAASIEIHPRHWQQRPWWQQLKELAASLFEALW